MGVVELFRLVGCPLLGISKGVKNQNTATRSPERAVYMTILVVLFVIFGAYSKQERSTLNTTFNIILTDGF